MASTTKITQNSWTQVKDSLILEGNDNYEAHMVYSPDGRFGILICFLVDSFTFRLVEMATGEIKEYFFQREEFTYEIKPIVYFVTDRRFVAVTFDDRIGLYQQQMYAIDTDREEINGVGLPIYIRADSLPNSTLRINKKRGCGSVEVGGKNFLVLPSADGLVLSPWNPLNGNSENPTETSIYLDFSFNEWKIKDYVFTNNTDQFHCFGSKVFFKAAKGTSRYNGGENGEDIEVMRDYFDRFVCLDLLDLDLTKKETVINEGSAMLSLVEMKPTTAGTFNAAKNYTWSQDGKYVIAAERRKFSRPSAKRPATKKRIYVIDLEEQTTSLVWARTRVNCGPTIYNGSLLIWRSLLPVERRAKNRNPAQKYDNFEINYEFKTMAIPNKKVQSLSSLAKNYILLGRNNINLSNCFITRFFES